MSEQQNSGRRSILESVVIVVSILLAFAIEALWDEQLESFTETKELGRLHTEFIANRDRIDRSINSQDNVRVATEEFYNLIKDSPTGAALSLPNNLMQAMLFAPTFDVTTPVLDSLILSGNLIVIEDEIVLREISSWQRSVAQVTEAEVGARDFTDAELFPSLAKRGNIGPLLIIEVSGQGAPQRPSNGGAMGGMIGMADPNLPNENGDAEQANTPPPATRTRFNDERETVIVVDDELKGIIAQRIREAGRAAVTLDQLEANANRLIAAIENTQEN